MKRNEALIQILNALKSFKTRVNDKIDKVQEFCEKFLHSERKLNEILTREDEIVDVLFFFLLGFSFTDTDDSQDSRERKVTIFYPTLPLPPAQEHSGIYLQLFR